MAIYSKNNPVKNHKNSDPIILPIRKIIKKPSFIVPSKIPEVILFIEAIAAIPGRDQLIAKFMGSVQSPVSNLVRTFQAIADAKEA